MRRRLQRPVRRELAAGPTAAGSRASSGTAPHGEPGRWTRRRRRPAHSTSCPTARPGRCRLRDAKAWLSAAQLEPRVRRSCCDLGARMKAPAARAARAGDAGSGVRGRRDRRGRRERSREVAAPDGDDRVPASVAGFGAAAARPSTPPARMLAETRRDAGRLERRRPPARARSSGRCAANAASVSLVARTASSSTRPARSAAPRVRRVGPGTRRARGREARRCAGPASDADGGGASPRDASATRRTGARGGRCSDGPEPRCRHDARGSLPRGTAHARGCG